MRGITCIVVLILMMGLSLAQELDDKMPLLEEEIITPEEELPPLPKEIENLQEEIGQPTSLGTPTIESQEEALTLSPPLSTETITSFKESEEKGTITPPLDTKTTQPSIGTTTIAVDTTASTSPPPTDTSTTPDKAPEKGTTTTFSGTPTTTHVSVGTSTIATTTTNVGTPTSKESEEITILNTGLILLPTAYRRDNKIGFNTDFIIAYYIGELWYKYKKDKGFFEPIKFLFLSGDFKFSLLKEKEKTPHLGAGYEWFLVLQGSAPSPAQMGGEFSGKSDRFGFPYFILSKEFKNTQYHLGMMSGEIGKLLNPLSKHMKVDSKKALIFGLDTKLFKRKINIEGICPVGDKFHLLINTSIEQFLGFDLGFMKMPDGFSIVGYFGVRLTIFPHIKDKK